MVVITKKNVANPTLVIQNKSGMIRLNKQHNIMAYIKCCKNICRFRNESYDMTRLTSWIRERLIYVCTLKNGKKYTGTCGLNYGAASFRERLVMHNDLTLIKTVLAF